MNPTKNCSCESISEEEKIARIKEVIEEYKGREGSLIQVLHFAQGIYGFLPLSIQRIISEEMNIPLSRVSGVVTFYSFFSTKPRGKNVIRVCLGTACYVRGGRKILQNLKDKLGIDVGETSEDMKWTLEVMRCIGACGLAPAITINDEVFKQVNPDKIQEILSKYK